MKSAMRPLVWLAASLFLSVAQADEPAEPLISNCQALVKIYQTRDEQRLLAGVSTSVSDALRAGWCKGVLDEYRRSYTCATNDWFTQAQKIAATSVALDEGMPNVEGLLEKSCAQ